MAYNCFLKDKTKSETKMTASAPKQDQTTEAVRKKKKKEKKEEKKQALKARYLNRAIKKKKKKKTCIFSVQVPFNLQTNIY